MGLIWFIRTTTSTFGEYEVKTEHAFIIKQFRCIDSIIHAFTLYWFRKYIVKEKTNIIINLMFVISQINKN